MRALIKGNLSEVREALERRGIEGEALFPLREGWVIETTPAAEPLVCKWFCELGEAAVGACMYYRAED